MAFPGTYNINYYSGDTLELQFSPVDVNGDPFTLTDYTAAMTIANGRGATAQGLVVLTSAGNDITIAPNSLTVVAKIDSETLPAGTYVYDLQITKDATVYTLVTGTFSVTADITGTVIAP